MRSASKTWCEVYICFKQRMFVCITRLQNQTNILQTNDSKIHYEVKWLSSFDPPYHNTNHWDVYILICHHIATGTRNKFKCQEHECESSDQELERNRTSRKVLVVVRWKYINHRTMQYIFRIIFDNPIDLTKTLCVLSSEDIFVQVV